jgi:hypothetical protein
MLQRKPMTALYEAVRRFLEHPQDDTGRAELEYHLGVYEAEAPGGGGSSWRPHPLNLHPPPTAESQAAFQRMVQVGRMDGWSVGRVAGWLVPWLVGSVGRLVKPVGGLDRSTEGVDCMQDPRESRLQSH